MRVANGSGLRAVSMSRISSTVPSSGPIIRSVRERTSPVVCGPRSTSTASTASSPFESRHRSSATCRYRIVRPPCDGCTKRTRPIDFSDSRAASTVRSSQATIGLRFDVWLHANRSAFKVSG